MSTKEGYSSIFMSGNHQNDSEVTYFHISEALYLMVKFTHDFYFSIWAALPTSFTRLSGDLSIERIIRRHCFQEETGRGQEDDSEWA